VKSLIEKYNHADNVIFISSYPEKGVRYSERVCAVGGFTKNTIEAFQKKAKNKHFIVLTVTLNGKKEIYEENGILVCRVFKRNKLSSYLSLIQTLLNFNKVKRVFIEFEFSSWGDTKTTSLFFLIPLLLKILKKKQIIVLHQVVERLDKLNGHLGWKRKDLRRAFFNAFLRLFYKILVVLSDHIVVTEEIFKERLIQMSDHSNKIQVITHGVDTQVRMQSRDESRRLLGLPKDKFIVMYFGYLNWYKGADLFLDYAQKTSNQNIFFVLAGGKSFTYSQKKHYQNYIKKFDSLPKNVRLTGFVPEDKLGLYYSAADLLVLPYRTMMSSSGPLSLTFSFEKPVLLSSNLLPYLKSGDFAKALEKTDLKQEQLFFQLNFNDFYKKISSANMAKLAQFSRIMKKERNYFSTIHQYLEMI